MGSGAGVSGPHNLRGSIEVYILVPVASAQVLTTGSWPTQTAAKCTLPRELEACTAQFQSYYLRAHSGRKLTWQTNMGNADLKVRPRFQGSF